MASELMLAFYWPVPYSDMGRGSKCMQCSNVKALLKKNNNNSRDSRDTSSRCTSCLTYVGMRAKDVHVQVQPRAFLQSPIYVPQNDEQLLLIVLYFTKNSG